MDLYYDDGLLSTTIEGISSKMPDSVKQSSYYVEDDNVIIVKGKSGVKVKEDTMKEEIVSVMKKIEEYEDQPIFKFKDYDILYAAHRYGGVYSQYISGDVPV